MQITDSNFNNVSDSEWLTATDDGVGGWLLPAGGGNIISRFNLAWLRGRRNPALLR